jgi:DNA-binding transcriptional regulator YiaG
VQDKSLAKVLCPVHLHLLSRWRSKITLPTPPNAIMSNVQKSIRNLKELRLEVGLTQYQLSQILDVRIKTVSDWERGVKQPHMPPPKMLFLCKTLNCSLEELVFAVELAGNKKSLDLSGSQEEQRTLVAA